MSSYTDYDTEQVRAQERSSSGMPTQHLNTPYNQPAPMPVQAGTRSLDQRSIIAGLLILFGILALGGNLPFWELETVPGMILLTISSGFLFFALSQRIYGLSIPGFILAGLAMGVTFVNVFGAASVLMGLSMGFASIYIFGRFFYNIDNPWPLIPGSILFLVTLIVLASSIPFMSMPLMAVPIILIGAGLLIGMKKKP
jgi:hypothetical protein